MKNGFIFKDGGIKRMPVANEIGAITGMSEEKTKVCPSCGRSLPMSSFLSHPRSADGKMKECIECHRRKLRQPKTDTESNPLAQFTARQLMRELKRRGYEGVLEYTVTQKIDISEM